jgi:uncharacterized protein (DUF169 family)
MNPNADLARQLEVLLGLKVPPVGLVFSDAPLTGIERIASAAPAGCGYWKRAARGEVFYTIGADHLGCAIGAHTHGVEMPPEVRENLMGTIGMMTDLQYLSASEVPQIPHRTSKLDVLTYGPLARLPREVDVVLVRATPRAAMLLAEATHAAGVRSAGPSVIRPACAMVPDVMTTRRAATSFGCIGNRVYTELPDDEVWWTLPGRDVPAVVAQIGTLVEANKKLEAFHRARA